MMMTAATNNNNSNEKISANPPSSSATTTKKSNGKSATSKVVASLENQILVLTKERDEAREFGETTVALFKKEKMQLKNEAKETQVQLLNEKRLWEQERKGLNEEVKRLESEVERLKKEKEASQEDNNNNNNNDISLTEFLDMEVALDKDCLLYTSPSPRDGLLSRMPSSA